VDEEDPPAGYEEYIRKYDDPGAFEELLLAEGVDYACVLAELSHATTGLCTNEQVRDFCKGRPRLIPFCDLNPHLHTDLGEELRRKVGEERFRGVKLYRPTSTTTRTTRGCTRSTGRRRNFASRS